MNQGLAQVISGRKFQLDAWLARLSSAAAILMIFWWTLNEWKRIDPTLEMRGPLVQFLIVDLLAVGTGLLMGCAEWSSNRGRRALFCLVGVLIVESIAINLSANQIRPLSPLTALVLISGSLTSRKPDWQAGFSVVGLLVLLSGSLGGLVAPFNWIVLFAAVAAVCFATSIRAQYLAQIDQAREKLADSRTTLSDLIETSPIVIVVSSLIDGRFINVNRAFLKDQGIERSDVPELSDIRAAVWADESQRRAFVKQLHTEGRVRNLEARFRSKDGHISASLISSVKSTLDGEPVSISFVRTNERQLISSREAALQASKAKSEFLATMSHEIRTPMHAVLGMADLLVETDLNQEQRKFVDSIVHNGSSLLELINDILDLAKIESGSVELEHTCFGLGDFFDRLCETLAIRAHSKHLELAVVVAPEVPLNLRGDPSRLRQILINLIGNAIKFTQWGEIIVEAKCAGGESNPGCLHFSVSDSGIGIEKKHFDTIFGSFTQADSSTTRKFGGTGLGLAIVKRLVGLMGGKIWVESELGKGSIFHFTARFEVEGAERAHSESAETLPSLEGIHALVVDDTAVNRLILNRMLSAKGAQVTEADSGAEALSKIELAVATGTAYQLILVDQRMPNMDGLQMLRRLRETAALRPSVIMMVTSDSCGSRIRCAGELGIDQFIQKPIRSSDLYDAITKVLEAKHRSPHTIPRLAVPSSDPQSVSSSNQALSILLADDSVDNRLIIKAFLSKEPYRLDLVQDGQAAVRRFADGRYDLVLMDMRMPVMDGGAAVSAIREWERARDLPRTPIIALTASALEDDVCDSLKAGCDLHLSKPVRKRELIDAIRAITAKA
ncbi:MAG: hybrid sensor histidine kinase/response regulator [Candidatus Binataceae bacterium]